MQHYSLDATVRDIIAGLDLPGREVALAERELRKWLAPNVHGISPLRALYTPSEHRDSITDSRQIHNDHLKRIELKAKALRLELHSLRTSPFTHADFWIYSEFGPIYENDFERNFLLTLNAVESAAVAARRKGGARQLGKQRVVRQAYHIGVKIDRSFCLAEGANNKGAVFILRLFQTAISEHATFDDLQGMIRKIVREASEGAVPLVGEENLSQ